MAKWFSVAAKSGIGEISIYSDIGSGGVTADQFSRDLQKLGKVHTINLNLSSNGGEVHAGIAIATMLKRHGARIIVRVDGLAASMASYIAMLGHEVIMGDGAMLMIHNPWGGVAGGADEIISFGEAMQKMRDTLADAYAGRTGLSRDTVIAMMDRETWLSAEEAVQLGFADRVEGTGRAVAAASIDVSKFKNAPRGMFATSSRKPQSMEEIAVSAFQKFNAAGTQRKPAPKSEDAES